MTNYFKKKQKYFCRYKNYLYICGVKTMRRFPQNIKSKEKMKITSDYLIAQGFKKQDDLWLNFDEPSTFYMQIREASGSDGFRLEIQRFKTKEFGVYGVNITPDHDGCLFMGYVTTIKEMETIIKACGIKTTPNLKICKELRYEWVPSDSQPT